MGNHQLIIGCGAGRTGTTSLAHLIDAQAGARVTHERFSFDLHWGKPDKWLAKIEAQKAGHRYYGDVALQWGSCLPLLCDRGARIVIMKRDLESWLESWKHKAGKRNNWQPPNEGGTPGRSRWYYGFPKFSGCKSRKQALRRYYEHYYEEIAPAALGAYPDQVKLFYVDALNSDAGQQGILDHVGIPRHQQIIRPGIRKNLGRHRKVVA